MEFSGSPHTPRHAVSLVATQPLAARAATAALAGYGIDPEGINQNPAYYQVRASRAVAPMQPMHAILRTLCDHILHAARVYVRFLFVVLWCVVLAPYYASDCERIPRHGAWFSEGWCPDAVPMCHLCVTANWTFRDYYCTTFGVCCCSTSTSKTVSCSVDCLHCY